MDLLHLESLKSYLKKSILLALQLLGAFHQDGYSLRLLDPWEDNTQLHCEAKSEWRQDFPPSLMGDPLCHSRQIPERWLFARATFPPNSSSSFAQSHYLLMPRLLIIVLIPINFCFPETAHAIGLHSYFLHCNFPNHLSLNASLFPLLGSLGTHYL